MTLALHPKRTETVPRTWLHSVVCGVDGTPGGREAARQAAELAGPHGALELVAVAPGAGAAPFVPPAVNAARALMQAEAIALRDCPAVGSTMVHARTAADGLIRAAAGADLLVVGCDAVGPVATALLRRAPCSILLARRPPDLPLCEVFLVAAGGEAAHHIAAAELAFAVGAELQTVTPSTIATAAAASGSGLIVLPDDAQAVQTARAASCSVLVIRPRP
jgi:hypothetical protein